MILDFLDADAGTANYTVVKRYLHGPAVDMILAEEDLLVSVSAPERVFWPHADNQGTVRDLLDNTGDHIEHYVYDAYGELVGIFDGSGTPLSEASTNFLYTGLYRDAETGFYLTMTRWYDPYTGRWIHEDWIGVLGGSNLNTYVGNSPTNYTDPAGTYGPDFHFYTIYAILRARGWDSDTAYKVAGWSQFVDDDPNTEPLGNGLNSEILTRYHFWGSDENQAVKRNPDELRELVNVVAENLCSDPNGPRANDLMRFLGRTLHTFADTWSHEGFTGRHSDKINRRTGAWHRPNIGHADTGEGGHYPDNPYNDIDKAIEAAKVIYSQIPRGPERHVPWHVLEGQLRQAFDAPPPSLRGQRYNLERTTAAQVDAMNSLIKNLFGDDVVYFKERFCN